MKWLTVNTPVKKMISLIIYKYQDFELNKRNISLYSWWLHTVLSFLSVLSKGSYNRVQHVFKIIIFIIIIEKVILHTQAIFVSSWQNRYSSFINS